MCNEEAQQVAAININVSDKSGYQVIARIAKAAITKPER